MFEKLEAELSKLWGEVSGDARKEVEAALAKAKQDEAAIAALVGTAKTQIEAAVAAAEPGVKTAVEAAVQALVAELEKLIATEV